jgi:hypothetical protein
MFNYKTIFLLLLISTFQVNAIAITGNTTGFFTDDGSEVNLLQWGGSSSPKSSIGISTGDFSANDSQPFKIAAFTYTNNEIREVFTSDVGLTIQLNFTDPAFTDSFVFDYDLLIDETSNNANNSDDTVVLRASGEAGPLLANINGIDFTIKVLGFKNSSDEFDNFFIQPENSNSDADLYAEVTAVPVPSAVWLFISAFTGLLALNNRRAV